MKKRNQYFCLILLVVIIPLGGESCSSESAYQANEAFYAITEKDKSDSESPKILSMSFEKDNNSYQLINDEVCKIVGDSVIECLARYLMPDKNLIATIVYDGDEILLNGEKAFSGVTSCDYDKPVKLTVCKGKQKKDYSVYVYSFTGLPILWIETQNRSEIVSKEEYINAFLKFEDNNNSRNENRIIESYLKIKGRGNSSWVNSPKKCFRLKFDEKISFLDEPKDKAWVLISNYFDKTMIRNKLAYYMGEISNMDYSPKFHYVELMLNGRYHGSYILGDKLKISKHRVNVGDNGFLVEIDAKAVSENGIYFYTKNLLRPVNIKDPDLEFGDDNYIYIKNYFEETERVLFSDNFKDPHKGWQKFLDMNSFVDWWIIHEISKNADALAFGQSCYMNLQRGGKLKMGPVWDFDQSFGNNNASYIYPIDGFIYLDYDNKWYIRLFEDPAFIKRVKERYDFFYKQKELFLNFIDHNANYLHHSITENEERWNILNSFIPTVNRDVWGSYNNEVQYLKTWLGQRMDWLKTAIDEMN